MRVWHMLLTITVIVIVNSGSSFVSVASLPSMDG